MITEINAKELLTTVVNLERKVLIAEKILEHLIINNPQLNLPNQEKLKEWQAQAIETLKVKYPAIEG